MFLNIPHRKIQKDGLACVCVCGWVGGWVGGCVLIYHHASVPLTSSEVPFDLSLLFTN